MCRAVESFEAVDSDDDSDLDDDASGANQGPKEKLMLFGGETGNRHKNRMATNDLLIFDPSYNIWYEAQATGSKPCPRSGHAMARLGRHLYVFGGFFARTNNLLHDMMAPLCSRMTAHPLHRGT
jgi:N-acetylneuraminic acid mutarotase